MAVRIHWFFLVGLFVAMAALPALAQVPPAPPASPTLWSFLGIPQAFYKMNAQLVNRRGNFPKLEKKPPLKAIADVANLKSDVPAIKAAAEIKQAEDLKPQKIKAIKYLAKIGCGCYDKDEKVTMALLAATEDCTEDVRRAAIEAVAEAAEKEACENCKQRSCCNEKLVTQLAKMAYERDDNGCYIEPSERVREAAIRALRVCCPGRDPVSLIPEEPVERADQPQPVEGTGGTPGGKLDSPPPPPPVLDRAAFMAPPKGSRSERVDEIRIHTQLASSRRMTADEADGQLASGGGEVASGEWQVASGERSSAPVFKKVTGSIVHVRADSKLTHLHLRNGATLPAGTAVRVVRISPDGSQITGNLVVTESQSGWANARPVNPSNRLQLVRGDEIEAWR